MEQDLDRARPLALLLAEKCEESEHDEKKTVGLVLIELVTA